MTELIYEVAKLTGVNPLTVAAFIPVTVLLANALTRAIPDTATGPLKYVRLVTKFIGIHVKDNSGVPAIRTEEGTVVRRTSEAATPESIVDSEEVLELTPEMEFKSGPFGLGAEALRKRENQNGQ